MKHAGCRKASQLFTIYRHAERHCKCKIFFGERQAKVPPKSCLHGRLDDHRSSCHFSQSQRLSSCLTATHMKSTDPKLSNGPGWNYRNIWEVSPLMGFACFYHNIWWEATAVPCNLMVHTLFCMWIASLKLKTYLPVTWRYGTIVLDSIYMFDDNSEKSRFWFTVLIAKSIPHD